jgi:hypothetical protein
MRPAKPRTPRSTASRPAVAKYTDAARAGRPVASGVLGLNLTAPTETTLAPPSPRGFSGHEPKQPFVSLYDRPSAQAHAAELRKNQGLDANVLSRVDAGLQGARTARSASATIEAAHGEEARQQQDVTDDPRVAAELKLTRQRTADLAALIDAADRQMDDVALNDRGGGGGIAGRSTRTLTSLGDSARLSVLVLSCAFP